MLLVGVIIKKHPVSDMSRHNGYNTPTSRKSQAHWDYAQKIAPSIYISLGKYLSIIEIIISIILLILQVPVEISIIIGSCIGFAFLYYGFYYTDSKIEERFSDEHAE